MENTHDLDELYQQSAAIAHAQACVNDCGRLAVPGQAQCDICQLISAGELPTSYGMPVAMLRFCSNGCGRYARQGWALCDPCDRDDVARCFELQDDDPLAELIAAWSMRGSILLARVAARLSTRVYMRLHPRGLAQFMQPEEFTD